eukprot:2858362-Pleurochrysis_carterae.AAC.1
MCCHCARNRLFSRARSWPAFARSRCLSRAQAQRVVSLFASVTDKTRELQSAATSVIQSVEAKKTLQRSRAPANPQLAAKDAPKPPSDGDRALGGGERGGGSGRGGGTLSARQRNVATPRSNVMKPPPREQRG